MFGTTKTFQRKIYETFIPKRFQRKRKPRKNLSISLGNSRPSPHMPASQQPVQQVDEFSLNDMNPKFTTTVNYSPQYPSDGNVSPRVPHGAHSNSRVNAPRYMPSYTPSYAPSHAPSHAPSNAPSHAPRQATTMSYHQQPSPSLHPIPLRPPRPMTGLSTISPSLHSKFSSNGRPETRDKALPKPPPDEREYHGRYRHQGY